MCSHLVLVIISLWTITEAVFTFQCPVQSQWNHRASFRCEFFNRYFCLYDKNEKSLVDFCRDNVEIEAPGYKLVVAGSFKGTLDGDECDNDFYQPFKFLSSGNSHCVYQKSYCSEEGQVVFGNGTLKNDRLCRCDYTKGYDFIERPKHPCFCEPTKEDCSCYSKKCSADETVSPDYECVDESDRYAGTTCKPIETVGLPGNSKIQSTAKPMFGTYLTVYYGIKVYRNVACVAVLLLTLTIIIMKVGYFCVTLGTFSLRTKHRSTELVHTLHGCGGEYDDTIANKNYCRLKNALVNAPPHVKEFQNSILQNWQRELTKIVKTRAAEFVYKKVKTQNVIVIAGPTGSGKSAYAYYSAFKLKDESGYTIIPVRQPEDITNYHVPGTKQIFIVDDFIGKYTVNGTDLYLWEKQWPLLEMMFRNNDDTKLILTSRTYIWQPEQYAVLSLCAYTCDLLSVQIRLSLSERWDICHSYLNKVDTKSLTDEIIVMYSFLPSLCSSYISRKNVPVEQFFTVPYEIIEYEITNFKIKSQVSYIAMAILAIRQNISNNSFSINNDEFDGLFRDVFHESTFLHYPSKNLLKSTLVALTGTYVKHFVTKDNDNFMFTHETLQNIVLRCIANTLIKTVIKHCKTEVILNQIQLNCMHLKQDVCTIEITEENEKTYLERLVYELGKGWNKSIFENEHHNIPGFRLKFLKCMKKNLSRDYWEKNQDDMPPFHIVSALGYQEYVSYFMQDSTMINKQDSDGNTPLHFACMKGHRQIVQSLVDKKSIIDIANNEGVKPFVYACENNHTTVAKFLLYHCAKWININEKYRRRNNGSVLHIVSARGFVSLMVLLLGRNAAVDLQDEHGCTPLHLAENSAVVHALLQYNANINAVDTLGRCPVYFACITQRERVLQLLIENNADINQKTINGLRPIHAACQFGSIGIVKMLLEKGAKINSSRPGIIPLHEACKVGNESIINTLIAANTSVNHKTKDGFTPLHDACKNKHVNVVKILLDNKANVNEANKYGWTALFCSCSNGCRTIVDLLLQHGANLNIYDEDKCSPLMLACKEEYTDVVNSLLSSKANVNYCDSDNCSSLLIACKTGNVDLVSVLLKYAADINLADKNMITPLHIACMNNNNTHLVQKLVENMADVNATDKFGQTPLFKSIVNGYTDIVDILLRHGASVDIRDKSGNSPLAIAEKRDIQQ